ncbi:uncharacterized protein SCHCODRAFT_02359179 [Schizophyllum commune H4-8]|uniref:uncharacterized protein n=1 Tax=Schizophyllum commune (strain H4-8 / FGSC 9210) TaxID=578458 RepID=UPI00215FFBF6|nr:uncharacterized protein SCHCODRAFT_02359179 [Schizophyllum commune H4-8]KAI5889092.1 hypothetical protein SCHCODRAFT_02359179 [Schizophyllum commune H4-8]
MVNSKPVCIINLFFLCSSHLRNLADFWSGKIPTRKTCAYGSLTTRECVRLDDLNRLDLRCRARGLLEHVPPCPELTDCNRDIPERSTDRMHTSHLRPNLTNAGRDHRRRRALIDAEDDVHSAQASQQTSSAHHKHTSRRSWKYRQSPTPVTNYATIVPDHTVPPELSK